MRTLLATLLLFLAPLAQAQSPPADGYVGRVPVADQSDAARDPALVAALAQVLERASGKPAAAPELQPLATRAPRWVQRYSYERDVTTGQLLLVAGFDGHAIDSALRAQHLPVWGAVTVPAEAVEFSISGIESIRDYARVLALLRALPGLRTLSVSAVEDNRLQLQAGIEGGGGALAELPGLERVPNQPLHFRLLAPAP